MATRNTDRSALKGTPCPCLARLNAQQGSVAPIDYPSFENHCLAVEGETALPLTEQATFCLSGSYGLCDRFRSAYPDEQPPQPLPLSQFDPARNAPAMGVSNAAGDESWAQPTGLPVDDGDWHYRPQRPVWAWAGAAAIFAAVLLFGGGLAAYIGWQLVSQEQLLAGNQPTGQINTLANVPTQAPAIIVVTAISEQPTVPVASVAQPPDEAQPVATQPSGNAQPFPAAVTPTPIVVQPPAASGDQPASNNGQPAPTDPPANILLPTTTGGTGTDATPVPVINVLQEVPTRRSTPEFELPTSTPIALDPPTTTPTASPTLAILGTPMVIFGPDLSAVPPGECTNIRWHVENVREVYYDNLAAFGDGAERECIDEEAESYALRVHFADGQTKIYTATINVAWPTPTITPTPVFTLEPVATPTWTPVPPTVVPTPIVVYGVALRLNDGNRQACKAGVECEIAVLATNMGDKPDTLSVEILQRGTGNAWLCRQDGVCAEQKLSLSNVGPGNTAFIVLRLTLPADSAGGVQSYVMRAISDGSLGTITSEAVTLEVESQSP